MDAFPEEFNLASWLLDERVAEGKGDRVAVIDGEKKVTYRELQQLVNRVGNGLLELDVDMEDRVLLVLPDGIELIAAWLAAVKIGAVVAGVPPHHKADQYERMLNITRARTLVIDAAHRAQIEEAIPGSQHLRRVITVGEPDGKQVSWEEIVSSRFDELESAPTHREDVAVWMAVADYGQDLRPIAHTHQALASNARAYAQQAVGLREDDVVISWPSLTTERGILTGMLFPISCGSATVTLGDDRGDAVLRDAARRHHATVIDACSRMTLDWLQAGGGSMPKLGLEGVRLVTSSGRDVPEGFHRQWTGPQLLTDDWDASSLMFAAQRQNDVLPGALGRPLEGCEVKIVRKDGSEAGANEKGILWVRQPCVTPHFWHDEARTRETLRDGWVKIGGAFSIDADGYVWYQGALES